MIQEANLAWAYIDTETKLIMPWYTLPTLQWLKTMDVSQWNVFEYGAGYSTIWWRANCLLIKSVDSNEVWASATGSWYAKLGHAYINACNNGSEFDCIIIDGDLREDSLKYGIGFLKSGGFLIIDNWDQEDFPHDAVERTLDLLKEWEHQIYAQPNHRTWKTAVLKKP